MVRGAVRYLVNNNLSTYLLSTNKPVGRVVSFFSRTNSYVPCLAVGPPLTYRGGSCGRG
jgi:hypothetical protein